MSSQSPQRINLFEALRGLLAAWVLFAHIGLFTAIVPGVGGILTLPAFFNITPGHAVEVFMILSGFVIFFLLDKSGETYGVFIFRRFFRLFPVFFIALMMGVLLNSFHQEVSANVPWHSEPWFKIQLFVAQNDKRHMLQHIAWHLPMLHGLVPDKYMPYADAAFSGPGWSISTEWQFYLIAPLVFALYRRKAGFLFFTIATLLCPFLPAIFPKINDGQPMRSFVLTQIAWFYIGTASYFVYRETAGRPHAYGKLLKFILAVMLIYFATSLRLWFAIVVWVAFFGFVLSDVARHRQFAAPVIRLLNSRFLQYIGKISYPIYLLHWPILIFATWILMKVNPVIDHVSAYLILLVVVPATTLLISHLVHQWVEKPSIDLARRICQRKGRREPASVTQLESKSI
jgi:peptidoglycan/LPS O-acetylase OafA/YrhL